MEWQNDIGRYNGLSTICFAVLLIVVTVEKTVIKVLRELFRNPNYVILSDEWFKLLYSLIGYFILSLLIIAIIVGVQEKYKQINK